MGLKFGTSGVRGLVTEFTDREAYLLTTAFLQHANVVTPASKVSVGMDLRESSPKILNAIEKALADHQKDILNCGVLPTPALAYYSAENKSLAIMVTGSHIPADRNGIKFYLATGETLKNDDEQIFANYQKLQAEGFAKDLFDAEGSFLRKSAVDKKEAAGEARDLFIDRYVKALANHSLKGMKVVFYEHSSAAREYMGNILDYLGAQVIRVGRSETFIPVDTEAVESMDLFKKWITDYGADALISTDGDGDRPLVIDNKGRLIQGDKLGIICSEFLGVEAIALPISCNSGVSQIKAFKKIIFTKIGSPYVVEALNALNTEYKSVAGFEANGGYILSSPVQLATELKSLPTRDSILPALAVLGMATKRKCSVSDVVDKLPARFTSSVLAKNCPPEKSQKIIQSVSIDADNFMKSLIPDAAVWNKNTLDGFRMMTTQGQIVHLRPSGNAPEFRCYTEASTQAEADAIATKALNKILLLIKEI
ncbi:phosphomannomutase [Bdellovibrio sp. HCB290]|uniref:phosphomannomutase n=1 Tax=Bdellovibrio sp. HCB290 TaxID=3394356 RepID=UPI0039B66E43